MVIDAQVLLTVKLKGQADAPEIKQSLYPAYHSLTLPLNSLNFIFDRCTVAFNQTSELTCDK